jgi:hypothetical protein
MAEKEECIAWAFLCLIVLFVAFIVISISPLGDVVFHDIRSGVKICNDYGKSHPELIEVLFDASHDRCVYWDKYPNSINPDAKQVPVDDENLTRLLEGR